MMNKLKQVLNCPFPRKKFHHESKRLWDFKQMQYMSEDDTFKCGRE